MSHGGLHHKVPLGLAGSIYMRLWGPNHASLKGKVTVDVQPSGLVRVLFPAQQEGGQRCQTALAKAWLS